VPESPPWIPRRGDASAQSLRPDLQAPCVLADGRDPTRYLSSEVNRGPDLKTNSIASKPGSIGFISNRPMSVAFVGQGFAVEADDGACSKGCPALTHASIPPKSGCMLLNPACFRCFAAIAADASFGHAQYTTISRP
jgi:hypothetical protein